ncbi:substrate-binding domain-containing protein [Ancylobacter terrae]|uniref:substrate-binding domain-containing protein n=1 Tax=Ancylobacter sp. sgz301288 TaxID=3342077 RepID=UPI00385C9671
MTRRWRTGSFEAVRVDAELFHSRHLPAAVTRRTMHSEPIDLLSAGAVKAVLGALSVAFHARTGVSARITFDTAPAIAARLKDGQRYDFVVAPRPLIDGLVRDGEMAVAERIALARVGVGLVGVKGRVAPDISDEAGFAAALREAEAIVVNRASTGLHVEKIVARLGLAAELEGRLIRLPTGRDVMVHMADAPSGHVGFGAVTEIEVHRDLGVRLAAELPASLQNYTIYDAVSVRGAAGEAPATDFLRFVVSPAADSSFGEARVERLA